VVYDLFVTCLENQDPLPVREEDLEDGNELDSEDLLAEMAEGVPGKWSEPFF
jgi:hypothetical protein